VRRRPRKQGRLAAASGRPERSAFSTLSGCSFFLVRALGRQRALRILLEGKTLDAASAVELGLADELVPDARAAALAFAETIIALEPALVRDIKTAVRLADERGFEASLEFEAWAQAASARSDRLAQAVAAFSGR
jgi:enoyl-CoA hydratase